jgi:hypothetical protein
MAAETEGQGGMNIAFWRTLISGFVILMLAGTVHSPADASAKAASAWPLREPSLWERCVAFIHDMLSADVPKKRSAAAKGDYLSVAGVAATTGMTIEVSGAPLVLPLDSPFPTSVRIVSGPNPDAAPQVDLESGAHDALFPGVQRDPGQLVIEVAERIPGTRPRITMLRIDVVPAINSGLPEEPSGAESARIEKALRLYFGPEEKDADGVGKGRAVPIVRNPWALAAYQILYGISQTSVQPQARRIASEQMQFIRQAKTPGGQ